LPSSSSSSSTANLLTFLMLPCSCCCCGCGCRRKVRISIHALVLPVAPTTCLHCRLSVGRDSDHVGKTETEASIRSIVNGLRFRPVSAGASTIAKHGGRGPPHYCICRRSIARNSWSVRRSTMHRASTPCCNHAAAAAAELDWRTVSSFGPVIVAAKE
jgi:hypothetical protein